MQAKHLYWGVACIIMIILVVGITVIVQKTLYVGTGSSGSEYMSSVGDSALYQKGGVAEEARTAVDSDASTAPNVAPTAPSSDSITNEVRLIVRSGTMAVLVKDVSEAVQKISTFALEKGGYIVSSEMYTRETAPSGQITIRIPVQYFDEAISSVGTVGEVESKSTSGQDVTEEYIDLDAQIRNLRATEEQFLQIMKQATRIEDILAVQRELTWVRRDIERIEGRMKYLKESAAMSTITIHVSTDPANLPVFDDDDTWKPLAVLKKALRSLVEFGKGVVTVLIWFVVYIPLWLVLFLVGWAIKRFVEHRKRV